MKRIALGIVVVLFIGVSLLYLFRRPITLRLMERVVTQTIDGGLLTDLPDGLHVVLCGAGSPLPDPQRSGPCVAVIAGGHLYIVDSGSGSSRTLGVMRIPQGRIDAILLTHFHSDHIDGLGEMMLQRWAGGSADTPTPVYGPLGVEEVVDGFNRAYRQDATYRVAHHGPQVVPSGGAGGEARPFPLPGHGEGRIVLENDGVEITAFLVDHRPVEPAVGYRFDYKGRSVVISGDTVKSANLQRFAAGADLLVHEALARQLVEVMSRAARRAERTNIEKITTDILDYHASPVEAAEIARDAKVGMLLYYHIVPPLPFLPLREVFLEGVAEVYDGPVIIGSDGTFVRLEAGSDAIEVEELL
jgi:ribonuclease Z